MNRKGKALILSVIGTLTVALMSAIMMSYLASASAEKVVAISINKLGPDAPNPLGVQPVVIDSDQLSVHPDLQTGIAEVDKNHATLYNPVAFDGQITLGQANALLNAFSFVDSTQNTDGNTSYLTVLTLNNERYVILLIFP